MTGDDPGDFNTESNGKRGVVLVMVGSPFTDNDVLNAQHFD